VLEAEASTSAACPPQMGVVGAWGRTPVSGAPSAGTRVRKGPPREV